MLISKSLYKKMVRLNKLAYKISLLEIDIMERLKSIGVDTEDPYTEECIANYLIYGTGKEEKVNELLDLLNLEVK